MVHAIGVTARRTVPASLLLAIATTFPACTPQTPNDGSTAVLGIAIDSTDASQNPQSDGSISPLSSSLRVSPDELRFGARASALTLYVRNVSNKSLTLSVAGNAPWIQLDRTTVTIAPENESQIAVALLRKGLADGAQTASVTLSNDALAPLIIPVTAVIEPADTNPTIDTGSPVPEMEVTPAALDFGLTARSLSFLVRNRGIGVLQYSASADSPWISIQNGDGTSEGQFRSVTVSVDRSGLTPGAHSGAVTVTGGGVTVSVPVALSVEEEADPGAAGRLTVSHDQLDFGNAQNELTVLVRYIGAQRANYIVESNVAWASSDVSAGSSNGEFDPIHVTVNRTGVAPGNYTGSLTFRLEDGTQRAVTLAMAVAAAGEPPAEPDLFVSSDLLEYRNAVTDVLFLLQNTGGGTIQYSITAIADDAEWITVTPNSGANSGELDLINVAIDRAYLSNGTFHSQITILASTGATRTINVLVENQLAPPVDPDQPDLVEWPTSDENMSYVVMVQQYAVPNLGPWSCCPLTMWGTNAYLGYVTMGIEPQHSTADLSALFEATKNYIRNNIPDAVFCSYISGGDCRKIDDNLQWPYTAVPFEEMPPGSFIEEYREDERRITVDIANLETMTLFADKIIEHTINRGVPVVWLDNVRHIGSGGTNAPWPTVASFLSRITFALRQAGIRTVANIALVPYGLSDADALMLMYSVHGICIEMPFHPDARERTDWTEKEIGRYRQWMDFGLHIELIPHWFPDGGNRDEAHDFIAGMIMIMRRPGDSIFLSHVFFDEPPHWAYWPRDFGAPLADYTIIAHDPPVLRREFEHAIITVDAGKTLVGATHGDAVQIQWR